MEAKDTVLTETELKCFLGNDIVVGKQAKQCLERQTEITWDIAFKAGIREVVEWIMRYRSESTREFVCLTLGKEAWQTQLKEWGI